MVGPGAPHWATAGYVGFMLPTSDGKINLPQPQHLP